MMVSLQRPRPSDWMTSATRATFCARVMLLGRRSMAAKYSVSYTVSDSYSRSSCAAQLVLSTIPCTQQQATDPQSTFPCWHMPSLDMSTFTTGEYAAHSTSASNSVSGTNAAPSVPACAHALCSASAHAPDQGWWPASRARLQYEADLALGALAQRLAVERGRALQLHRPAPVRRALSPGNLTSK